MSCSSVVEHRHPSDGTKVGGSNPLRNTKIKIMNLYDKVEVPSESFKGIIAGLNEHWCCIEIEGKRLDF